MISILIFLLIIVAILLMAVVLIQSSKGGGLAGTFGGGGGDATAVFGVRRTADFLVKVTSTLATILLLFSLFTNVLINKDLGSKSSFLQEQPQTLPGVTTPDQLQQQPAGDQQQNQQPPADQNQQPPADQNQQPAPDQNKQQNP